MLPFSPPLKIPHFAYYYAVIQSCVRNTTAALGNSADACGGVLRHLLGMRSFRVVMCVALQQEPSLRSNDDMMTSSQISRMTTSHSSSGLKSKLMNALGFNQ
ncbi:hypothetical protein Aduo_015492 [Ancylostoma duodenale]